MIIKTDRNYLGIQAGVATEVDIGLGQILVQRGIAKTVKRPTRRKAKPRRAVRTEGEFRATTQGNI